MVYYAIVLMLERICVWRTILVREFSHCCIVCCVVVAISPQRFTRQYEAWGGFLNLKSVFSGLSEEVR